MKSMSNRSVQGERFIALPILAVMLAFTWGCDSTGKSTGPDSPSAETDAAGDARERPFEDFDPGNFSEHSIHIDNEWLPLKPGTQLIFEGESVEGGEREPHRIEYTVTDLTKVIDGVRTRVVWLVDYSDGELVEKEIAFFAQGNDGSVWYFGEHPEEYEDGEFIEAPSWLAGIEEARPGLAMQAEPQPGTPSYSQGWAPAVDWTDRAQVGELGREICGPVDCYKDTLVIDEYNLKEPGIKEKYYARGVGNVGVGWRGEAVQQEELELIELNQLEDQELAKIRSEALALERHAFEISPDMYALSEPIPGAGVQVSAPVPKGQSTASTEPVMPKLSEEKAREIALQAVPGTITDLDIERKLGAKRYVVEVIAEEDGEETDVIIDMETGEVLDTEK
jgi:uncharacterized membrane protein YkoI